MTFFSSLCSPGRPLSSVLKLRISLSICSSLHEFLGKAVDRLHASNISAIHELNLDELVSHVLELSRQFEQVRASMSLFKLLLSNVKLGAWSTLDFDAQKNNIAVFIVELSFRDIFDSFKNHGTKCCPLERCIVRSTVCAEAWLDRANTKPAPATNCCRQPEGLRWQ